MAELALSSGRMHLSPVGTNRRCFLASSALCAIVLLLIPTLQTPQHQGELPRPLPHTRPARRENATGFEGTSIAKHSRASWLPFPSDKSQRDSGDADLLSSRSKEPLGLKDIFIAVKTTRKYHKSRLELLFQTWVSEAMEQVGHTLDNQFRRDLMQITAVSAEVCRVRHSISLSCLGAERRRGECSVSRYFFFLTLYLYACRHWSFNTRAFE